MLHDLMTWESPYRTTPLSVSQMICTVIGRAHKDMEANRLKLHEPPANEREA